MEYWTPGELTAYKQAVRLAPKQKKAIETRRKRKLNTLFNRIVAGVTKRGEE